MDIYGALQGVLTANTQCTDMRRTSPFILITLATQKDLLGCEPPENRTRDLGYDRLANTIVMPLSGNYLLFVPPPLPLPCF
jgi:hypothetical protein